MKIGAARLVLLGVLCSSAAGFAAGEDIRFGSAGVVHFCSPGEAADILRRKDDFIQRLSAFDRAARMKADRSIATDEFISFVKATSAKWSDAEVSKVRQALGEIEAAVAAMQIALPKTISLVKTTGAEEGNAFYTRDTAIMFPERPLDAAELPVLKKTIAHELFHVVSRADSTLREKLYESIGFRKCDEAQLPADLQDRRITNPDAARNDHSIQLRAAGEDVTAIPVLIAASDKYDVNRGGEFFQYLQLKFLVRPRGATRPADRLLDLEQLEGFFEQVGRNTNYIIHPEEILADNFALLVLGESNVASPEVLQRMRNILVQH